MNVFIGAICIVLPFAILAAEPTIPLWACFILGISGGALGSYIINREPEKESNND